MGSNWSLLQWIGFEKKIKIELQELKNMIDIKKILYSLVEVEFGWCSSRNHGTHHM